MSNPNGTQAVDRAARLLSEVVHAPDPVTFTELTAVTGLAKSTTSRLLLALERNHLVRRDDHGRFLPGEMFVSFAWRGGADTSLVAVAQPFLDRLGKATGETVNLGVAAGKAVEQIAQVDCAYMIGGTNWVGRPVLGCTPRAWQVLLAYGAAKLAARRAGAARQIITSERCARIAAVRARGYAVTDEEPSGLIAWRPLYSATTARWWRPCRFPRLATRMNRETAAHAARHCVDEAGGLSSALGHRPRTSRKG
jgi:DNA-binding IclR family transcriptional regulator